MHGNTSTENVNLETFVSKLKVKEIPDLCKLIEAKFGGRTKWSERRPYGASKDTLRLLAATEAFINGVSGGQYDILGGTKNNDLRK